MLSSPLKSEESEEESLDDSIEDKTQDLKKAEDVESSDSDVEGVGGSPRFKKSLEVVLKAVEPSQHKMEKVKKASVVRKLVSKL